ncbi:MAG TPA: winged helix-turn-helix transcriptional regulator [Pseudonocardia sp.]|nr:winged helix-turn-helix transcriptional regulator [Pseudonocardia sp.]
MAGQRSYDDPCGVARALDAVGERWALLLVRELLLGPKRFTDLASGLPGISQNVLSQRLRELEGSGMVRRRRLGPPAGARVYELTERGQELEPVLLALARWGSRAPTASSRGLSVDALALALRTTFEPEAAGTLAVRLDLRLGDDRLRAEVGEGRFRIARGEADGPDAAIETDPATLRSLVFGGRPLRTALDRGEVAIHGEEAAVTRFLGCFSRPARAAG